MKLEDSSKDTIIVRSILNLRIPLPDQAKWGLHTSHSTGSSLSALDLTANHGVTPGSNRFLYLGHVWLDESGHKRSKDRKGRP